MNQATIIEVESIKTVFGNKEIHNDISFSINAKKVVAIIGGSGSGKSVLLREMIGLQRPTSGTIKILGTDICASSEDQLEKVYDKMGVLFQQGALFSALTVSQNIAVPLHEKTSLDTDTINQIVGFKLLLVGLEVDIGNKMPSDLSGGMRKRVALARALALDPQLLFLDEPNSGLDPIGSRSIDSLIRTLCDSLGLTIILITHDMDTLKNIVDHIIIIGEGRILAEGSYEEVSTSKQPWVAEYFSSRNLQEHH